jgi:integrating conjugative element protein (TIGR03758 family)
MLADTALTAFQTTSGIAPDKLSLLVRTILLGLTLIWSGWCVAGLIHHIRHRSEVNEYDTTMYLVRICIQVVAVMVLVFI